MENGRKMSGDINKIGLGHRERMKNYVKLHGLNDLSDLQILEFLLFYGIPYKDTQAVAAELLQKFGSLYEVLLEDFDSLMAIKNMTANAAMLLVGLKDVIKTYIRERDEIYSLGTITEMLVYITQVMEMEEETLYLLSLNEHNKVLSVDKIKTGSRSRVVASAQEITGLALRNGAKKVVFVHNHPSGTSEESQADLQATYRARKMMMLVDIDVVDHFIIGAEIARSMFTDRNYEIGVYKKEKRI